MTLHKDLNLTGSYKPDEDADYRSLIQNFPRRPTIFIGLGGTGADSVAKIKRLFELLYEPKEEKAIDATPLGIPSNYAFLGFDTNQSARPLGLHEEREWFHLGVEDMAKFYRNLGRTAFFRSWLIKGYPASSIMSGASGFRNLGRLALLHNVQKVSATIDSAREQISRTKTDLVNPRPIVYMFCSLSGGTGSGMVLDMSFLVRQIVPQAEIIGMIGVFDGLPTMPYITRRDLMINTYCGLKELDSFMTRSVPGLTFGDQYPDYPFDVKAKVDRPFDECYLLSRARSDGAISLPEQTHVTSFMARLAFMMTAYSFRDDQNPTPDYSGVMNNHRHHLTGHRGGSAVCYLIPGMGQVHFPVVSTANLFALQTAIGYISYQCGGTMREGDKEAREFAQRKKVDYRALREGISLDPRVGGSHPLAAERYDQRILDLMEDGKRYDNADDVLQFGKKVPHNRFLEIETILKANVESIFANIWSAVQAESASLMVNPQYLARGAIDFLIDLKNLLAQEVGFISREKAATDRDFESLESRWRELEGIVKNVVTDDGTVDRVIDRMRLPRIQQLYVTFLNEAEGIILEKVRSELTKQLLNHLMENLGKRIEKYKAVFEEILPESRRILEERRLEIATLLHRETEGHAPDVENVCSYNVMTQEWRERYFAKAGHLQPAMVLNDLKNQNWHPERLIDLKAPKGINIALHMAQDILNRVAESTGRERELTPIEVIQMSREYEGQTPEKAIANLYFRLLKPQMQLSGMKNILGSEPHSVVFCGGIDSRMKKLLEEKEELRVAKLNVADNLERNRFNFFTSTLPVAAVGLNLITDVLKPQYDSWAEDLQKEDKETREFELAKFHCFPDSFRWGDIREPEEDQSVNEIFGRALALSELLEPDEADRKKMNNLGRTPRDKKYGVFQVGKAQFWLTPFFYPQEISGEVSGRLMRLGANVFDAHQFVAKSAEHQEEARKWVAWFGENWSRFFTAGQMQERMAAALETFTERMGKTQVKKQINLWTDLIRAVKTWEIG